MVLPYAYGCHMLGVSKSGSSKFRSTLDENSLPPSWRIFKNLVPYSDAWGQSDEYNCGAVQFFKTSSYLLGGGENEFYVDYAPEDKERIHRFLRLGYRVEFLDNCAGIWHLNHDSSSQNHKKLTDNRMRYLFDLGKSKEEYAEYIKTFPRYQEMQSKYARLTSGGWPRHTYGSSSSTYSCELVVERASVYAKPCVGSNLSRQGISLPPTHSRKECEGFILHR